MTQIGQKYKKVFYLIVFSGQYSMEQKRSVFLCPIKENCRPQNPDKMTIRTVLDRFFIEKIRFVKKWFRENLTAIFD